MDNQKLSERVEALEGPRYSVECEIYKAVAPDEYHRRLEVLMNGPMKGRIGPADFDGYIKPPNYTASLDAAMSLVPEGCALQVQQRRSHEYFYVYFRSAEQHEGWSAKNDRLAIALCAAALKSRGL